MTNVPKIYIPNVGCHDFSGAEKFGTLTPITSGALNLLGVGQLFRTFQPIVRESKKEDYILICGPNVVCAILCSMFSIKHQRLNVLLYSIGGDGKGRYKQRNLFFNNNNNVGEFWK